MSRQYDELKNLLEASRKMLNKGDLTEQRNYLTERGILKEQSFEDNIDADIETEVEDDTEPEEEKTKKYRISGGLINMHGKDKQDLELTSEEKRAFQETMDDFVNEVSELSEFGVLNVYKSNVDWSGKILDFDVEFYMTIGEDSGVYVNGNMLKLDDSFVELINKLTSFYEKFKSKWSRVISSRRKTQDTE